MPATDILSIDPASPPDAFWREVAAGVHRWAGEHSLVLRDLVVLVPFAQLATPARVAFAALSGWQPRIETPATWAASLGPPPVVAAGALSGSPTLDRLTASQMLRRQAGLAPWEAADPRAFHQAVAALVSTAQALSNAARARPSGERAAYWGEAEKLIAGSTVGPGQLESLLGQLALEWARLSPNGSCDRLFEQRPAGLVRIEAGGPDPLAAALAAAFSGPVLEIRADCPPDEAFEVAARRAPLRRIQVDGTEAEARAVAGEVIQALGEGLRPVALITLDRELSRRVRALLERRQVAIADETGWALSTTRAAAAVMALLQAASPTATHDDRLAWLKSLPADVVQPSALLQLERAWRAGDTLPADKRPAASALLVWADEVLAPLQAAPVRRSLEHWLGQTAEILQASGAAASLAQDVAGRQVLAQLQLDQLDGAEPALRGALRAEVLDRGGFVAWIGRTLEAATFLPAPVADPDVVLTPLARAILRPFGAVVMGGADERHLLARARHEGLLAEPVARALGLDTPEQAQDRERLSLVQLLRVLRFSVLNRRTEGVDPVAASPALDAIAIARRRAGLSAWADGTPIQQDRQVKARPVHRPAPAAAADLPERLSASTLESLRACPYRFFARAVLSLREAEELDEGVDKRDYGNWLHAVLDRFHRERPPERLADEPRLRELADAVSAEMALSQARLLPFRIVFDALVPTYLAWLHQREDEGLRWDDGEFAVDRQPPELGGSVLHGRIDRLDRGPGRVRVVDYKTGSVSRLQAQLRNPLEDTQLPFYALLMQADLAADDAVFEALYLALDDAAGPKELVHQEVVDSARTMLAGLADELRRLREGAGLPALGEGSVCEHCEARGLCRRDHWEGGA